MPLLNANTGLKETWGRNVIRIAMWQYAYSLDGLPKQTQKGNDRRENELSVIFFFFPQ